MSGSCRVFGIVLTASLAVSLAGCGSSGTAAPDDVFFPKLDHRADAWPAGAIQGTLFQSNGCVFIETNDEVAEPEVVLLLWPVEAAAERLEDGTLQVLNNGAIVGRMGERVHLGGGFRGEARNQVRSAESIIEMEIPDRCKADGGYFLTDGRPISS
jgi:hypothetical protein